MARTRRSVRLSTDPTDLLRAQALRHRVFFGTEGRDDDGADNRFTQLLVEYEDTLVACARIALRTPNAAKRESYAAQVYDLTALPLQGPSLEVGRLSAQPDHAPDALRLIWAALTAITDRAGVGLLFGCASFAGADPARHAAAFAHLNATALAPVPWRPAPKARQTTPLANPAPPSTTLPPLLSGYLALGGWVSDHAVIDTAMDTCHVFTGVQVAQIPAPRARVLRRLAAQLDPAALDPLTAAA